MLSTRVAAAVCVRCLTLIIVTVYVYYEYVL